jgi:S-disulfanyl-L-cysteine oxidoreductase SoxD
VKRIVATALLVLGAGSISENLDARAQMRRQREVPKSVAPTKSLWDGVYTDAQASRGEALYVDNCIMCHGTALSGTILAPPVAGPGFLAKWNRKPLTVVFGVIQTTMPFNLSGHLRPQQNADILAYMLQKTGSPAGDNELSSRADALSTVVIVERKP